MSVYVIGQIVIKDEVKWEEYKAQVPKSLEGFDATIVLRGKSVAPLEEQNEYTDIVVLEFPTLQKAKAWHSSAQYQQLIPLRKSAAKVVLKIYDAM